LVAFVRFQILGVLAGPYVTKKVDRCLCAFSCASADFILFS
jgi:hypothetical protein